MKYIMAVLLACAMLCSCAQADVFDSVGWAFETRSEVAGYIGEQARACNGEYDLFVRSGAFAGWSVQEILDFVMEACAEGSSFTIHTEESDDGGLMHIELEIEYRSGVRMAHAFSEGQGISGLSADERLALETAQRMVDKILVKARDQFSIELGVYEALADHVQQVSDANASGRALERMNCAVGALLDGKANCRGYADAFYLLGTMAGLNVHMISNRACDWMFNGVWYEGQIRVVDVALGDMENEDPNLRHYVYFNVGSDRLDSRKHSTSREIWRDIAQETYEGHLYMRNAEYGFSSAYIEDLVACAIDQAERGYAYCHMMLEDGAGRNTGKQLDETLKAMLDRKAAWTWNIWDVGADSYISLRWDQY